MIGVPIMMVLLIGAYAGVETYTATNAFCGGSCHTMTEQYTAWKANKHHAKNNKEGKEAGCVDCHFLPGEHNSLKAKWEGLRHLAAYLYDKDAPLPIRPVVKDGACLQSGCHSKPEFEDKELKFIDKVRFKHKAHFDDKVLGGQKITCDTCHFKTTEKKHFEVPKEICFLCHLKLEKPTLEKVVIGKGKPQGKGVTPANVMEMSGMSGMTAISTPGRKPSFQISFKNRASLDFNQGASRCDICHTIPTKSLQAQLKAGDSLKEAITHQTIKQAGVPCESCHFEVVKGHGEINTGNVVSNGCLTCHNRSQKLLEQAKDKELMHGKHVPAKADCFDCHSVIEHKNRTDHLDFVREDCSLCHQDQHKYQKLLLSGTPVNEEVSSTPHLMFNVNVNCMACHQKKTLSGGHAVRSAAGDTCAACHTPKHVQMLEDWKKTVAREIKDVEEVELEAVEALKGAKGKLAGEEFTKLQKMITEGQEFLNIVRFGNGVHNKKYSVMILDQAITKFENAIEQAENGG